MPIIWSNGFEDVNLGVGSDGINNNVLINTFGWDIGVTGSGFTSLPGLSFSIVTGYRSGNAIRFNGLPSDASSHKFYFKRDIQNGNQMSLAYNYRHVSGTSYQNFAIGIFSPTENIYVRPSGNFLAVYVNNVLVGTGTIDVATGTPWTHVELRIDKTAGQAVLFINNVANVTVSISGSFTPTEVRVFSDKTSGTVAQSGEFDDMIFATDMSRIGASKCYGYFKTGNVTTTFNDGLDEGSASADATNVFNGTLYRSSATRNQRDLFSYNNILPAGVDFTNILAVNQITLACAGGYNGAALNQVLVSGATTSTRDISNLVPAFAGKRVNRILENDPATGLPWTASAVRAINVGYEVRDYGQVAFTTQPSTTATSGVTLATQPIVTVQTAAGATDTSYNGPVNIYINGNPKLNAIARVNAVNGVATFSGITLTGLGQCTMTAVVRGRSSANSNTITVS